MKCNTAPGFGKGHRWKIAIESRTSPLSLNVTSYRSPVITSIYGPGSVQGATAGNQEVYIKGDFFGPVIDNSAGFIQVFYGRFPLAWMW